VPDPQPGRIEPLDEFNLQLLDNVHPPAWANPAPKPRYHLVVIGAGTGGLVSAAAAAGLGARVALVERHLMGGDCLNVGCVPSKAIIRAARAWREAARARADFGGPVAEGAGDFPAVMARMRRIRAGISRIDGALRFRDLGVDVFLGAGRFAGPDTVEVDGKLLRFRRAIIATGGRPAVPPIPGLADAGYLTNETVFGLTDLPRRLAVIGGGPIGCELAQAFARFGSRVTLMERGPRLLPRDDPDAAAIVERAMADDGVAILRNAAVRRVERDGSAGAIVVERDGREARVEADAILVAAGRAPNVEGLGLESAGVGYGEGGVVADDRLRTSNLRVFAVGDVSSRLRFTHNSDVQARIAVQNALFFRRARASRLVMPWCTYTSPEVAHVGLHKTDARGAGCAVETLTLPLAEVDRAVLDGETAGFFRVHLKRGTDRILGATLVAEHAGEMIGEIGVAIVNGVGLGGIGRAIHPYPTQAEVFRKAADAWRRGKLTPRVRKVLDLFFRVLR
jgi:pyruvate/2-oxoglutarate dehydrogenase complex dihydrolipoamide dehydrogenase (E3) component